jgi:hypothetical protein
MRVFGYLLTALGTAVIVLSFAWASLYPPESRWTEEQAEEHARAGAHLHNLAHPGGHAHVKGDAHSPSHSEPKVNEADLEAARLRWENSKAALRAAKTHSNTTANWLRYGGTAATLAGVVALVLDRKRRSNRRSVRGDS